MRNKTGILILSVMFFQNGCGQKDSRVPSEFFSTTGVREVKIDGCTALVDAGDQPGVIVPPESHSPPEWCLDSWTCELDSKSGVWNISYTVRNRSGDIYEGNLQVGAGAPYIHPVRRTR